MFQQSEYSQQLLRVDKGGNSKYAKNAERLFHSDQSV